MTASTPAERLPWTNVYGLGRSLVAMCTLVTLAVDNPDHVFRPLGTMTGEIVDNWVNGINFFQMAGPGHLHMVRWMGVAIMLLVVSGWRPRITGILHWWIAFSFTTGAILIEGGDQIAANVALFLLPVTLLDDRRWHWQRSHRDPEALNTRVAALIARSAFIAIRVQMCVLYLHASIGKMHHRQWSDGTALYYWFTAPTFGMPDWLGPFLLPILQTAPGVMIMTWSVILLELTLGMALVMDRRWRPRLLPVALLFHLSIILVNGLGTFFFAMAGGLVLYLWPIDEPFSLALLQPVRATVARVLRRGAPAVHAPETA